MLEVDRGSRTTGAPRISVLSISTVMLFENTKSHKIVQQNTY